MEVLEHQILKALYVEAGFTITATGSDEKGMTPLYKRDYAYSTMQFGVLADLIYNPEKYTKEKRPSHIIYYLQNEKRTKEQVNITEAQWYALADAVEVLATNKHITDISPHNIFSQENDRRVSLTHIGALSYRNKYYLKQYEIEEITDLNNRITRLELKQKKHWLRNELIKFSCTATLGALIALTPKLLDKIVGQKEQTPSMKVGDTISVKLYAPTKDTLLVKTIK